MQTYYHITPELHVTAIMLEGLKPRVGPRCKFAVEIQLGDNPNEFEAKPHVYLFEAREDAEKSFAAWLGPWCKKFVPEAKTFVMFEVELTAAEVAKAQEQYIGNNENALICGFTIPPARLKQIKKLSLAGITKTWDDITGGETYETERYHETN